MQIVTPLLNAQAAFGTEREADVGAIDLFFNRHGLGKEALDLLRREHLFITNWSNAKPSKIRGVGESEEGHLY